MTASQPALSIVIPTFNRAAPLRACLDLLARQTQPGADYEVVVVMDGSTDDTQSTLTGLRPPYRLRRVWQPNAGASAARNHGAQMANGEWLLFLDDDMQAEPEMVAAYLEVARLGGPAVLLGQVVTRLAAGADWFAQEFGREWAEHFAGLNGGRAPTWQDCYAGSIAMPRSAFEQCGGWAEDLRRNEDLEFGYRLHRAGLPMRYVGGAVSTQTLGKGFRALTRDVVMTGAASVAMQKRHPELLAAQLGWFGETTQTDMLGRRIVLGLRVPLALLDWMGRALREPEARWSWYRFVYNCAYWRGVRSALAPEAWRRLTSGTVILMYHAFTKPGETWGRFTLPVRRFQHHMAWLKFWGYNVISLEEYVNDRRALRLPPPRSVVITIDDGYADNYTLALPVLRRYRFPAMVFLVSQYIGLANEWDRGKSPSVGGRPLLTREQILEMRAAGISFGVHTRRHPALTGQPAGVLEDEIIGARTELEQTLGFPFTVFSFPYGKTDDASRAVVDAAGYAGAVGIEMRKNYAATPLNELRRVEIWGKYRLLDFITAVWLGAHRP